MRAPRLAALPFFATVLGACGARTGLIDPDVVRVADASVDAEVPPPICLRVTDDASVPVNVDLTTIAQVASADVLFVVDRTGSMDGEIDNIRQGLQTVIVPGLARQIADLQLGLVTYGDFAVPPYGSLDDQPFTLERPMSDNLVALQGSLNALRAGGGGDNPEALVEALYQISTGEGLREMNNSIPAAPGCPTLGTGYACVRTRAQPVLVVITDAPMHNGPAMVDGMPSNAYDPARFRDYTAPHTFEQATAALAARLHARVVGINSGIAPYSGHDDLRRLASDTGTLGTDGQPLVFDIPPDGSGLGDQVVAAVGRFTNEVRLDVSARAVDIDGSGGAALVQAVRPSRAMPMDRITRLDASTFYGVVPGTQLVFSLIIDPARLVPGPVERRYLVRIEYLASGRPTLGYKDVLIVVPAADAPCPQQ